VGAKYLEEMIDAFPNLEYVIVWDFKSQRVIKLVNKIFDLEPQLDLEKKILRAISKNRVKLTFIATSRLRSGISYKKEIIH